MKDIIEEYRATESAAGRAIPENANHYKYLDCAVFQYAYALIEDPCEQLLVDSARAVYVPTGEEKRIWTRSWISNGAHIQVCIRNPSCILGTWLHHPTDLEDPHATQETEAAEVDLEPEDQGSGQEVEGDADGGSRPTAGQGEADEPG